LGISTQRDDSGAIFLTAKETEMLPSLLTAGRFFCSMGAAVVFLRIKACQGWEERCILGCVLMNAPRLLAMRLAVDSMTIARIAFPMVFAKSCTSVLGQRLLPILDPSLAQVSNPLPFAQVPQHGQ
jgi:hypothetical protein